MTSSGAVAAHKGRGAYFTPGSVASFLAKWAIRSTTDRVLEPSAGEASFLLAAAKQLRSHGQLPLFPGEQLVGAEIHGPSIDAALRHLSAEGATARIIHSDFFDLPASPEFDVVLGNPPFVRYQHFQGAGREKSLRAALAGGVNLNGLASSWAAFVVHATRFLRPTGRLGFVLPAELLAVNYAAPVRRFLLERFERVRLIVFEELLFPDALEDVVLLMAEGSGGCDHFEVQQVRNAAALESSDQPSWTAFTPAASAKWTEALVHPGAWSSYQELRRGKAVETLGQWGRAYLGAVTGDNNYFALTDERVTELGLVEADLIPISPPGSRHLRGLEFSDTAWRSLRKDGKRGWLFWPSGDRLRAAAQRYVDEGERRGVHRAYKCAVRHPWYRTPLVDVPDLLLTYMDMERPRLTANTARVRHLNSLYGIKLHHGRKAIGRDLLPIAALNTLTLLGAEVVGRAYGGGMLKLEPAEAEKLPVPSIGTIQAAANKLDAVRPQLAVGLRQGRLGRIAEIIDRIVLLETGAADERTLQLIRDAREFLFQRRSNRAKNSGEAQQ